MDVIRRLYQRLLMVIGRGRVLTGNDAGNVQLLQISLDAAETRDNTPRLAEYGFSSMPPDGSDVIAVFIGGDRSNGAIIATGHQASRPKDLKPGEAIVYNGLTGAYMRFTPSGIVVDAAGGDVTVQNCANAKVVASTLVEFDSPLVKTSADLEVGGNITAVGDITDQSGTNTSTVGDLRTAHDDHDHPVPGVAAGTSTVTSDKPNLTA